MLGVICETHTISHPSSSNSLHVIKKDGFLMDVNAQGQRGEKEMEIRFGKQEGRWAKAY